MENKHPHDIDLFEYVSNELNDTDRAAVEQHLTRCEECKTRLRFSQDGEAQLHALPQLEMSQKRLEKILQSLGPQDVNTSQFTTKKRYKFQRWSLSNRNLLLPASAIAGLIAIAIIFTTQESQNESKASSELESAAEPLTTAEAFSDSPDEVGNLIDSTEENLDIPPLVNDTNTETSNASEETVSSDSSLREPDITSPPIRTEETENPSVSLLGNEPEISLQTELELGTETNTLALVQGDPEEIIALLADAGIEASLAEDGAIDVVGDNLERIRHLLAELPEGPLTVRVLLESTP